MRFHVIVRALVNQSAGSVRVDFIVAKSLRKLRQLEIPMRVFFLHNDAVEKTVNVFDLQQSSQPIAYGGCMEPLQ